MRPIHLPKWLYEKIPSLCVAAGSLAVVWSPNALATGSGLLLCVAGARLWHLRLVLRRKQARRRQLLEGLRGTRHP